MVRFSIVVLLVLSASVCAQEIGLAPGDIIRFTPADDGWHLGPDVVEVEKQIAQAAKEAKGPREDVEAAFDNLREMEVALANMTLKIEELEMAIKNQREAEGEDAPILGGVIDMGWKDETAFPPDAMVTNWYDGATNPVPSLSVSIYSNMYMLHDFYSPGEQTPQLGGNNYDSTAGTGTLILARQRTDAASPPTLVYLDATFLDEKVGVTSNDTTPGYLGGHGESGELRLLSTGGGSTNYGGLSAAGLFYKAFGAGADEYVALAHDDLTALSGSQGGGAGQVLTALSLDTASGNIGLTSVDGLGHVDALTWSNIGDVLTNSAYMPAGTNNYDLLRWQTSDDTWTLLLNDSSVLQYQVLQKKGSGAGGEVGYDWVRAH